MTDGSIDKQAERDIDELHASSGALNIGVFTRRRAVAQGIRWGRPGLSC